LVLVTILILAVATAGLIALASPYLFANPHVGGPGILRANCKSIFNETSVVHAASGGNGQNASFLIVETDPPSPFAGINGSYYVPITTQWPVLHVKMGQTVTIHVINCASSEPHGFQVQSYDDRQNISIQPGGSYDVTFVASRAGTFRIYCNIQCAIHPFMQNGALVVS
jgi:hypothetical protein